MEHRVVVVVGGGGSPSGRSQEGTTTRGTCRNDIKTGAGTDHGLEPQALRLDEVQRNTIASQKTLALVALNDSDGILLASEGHRQGQHQ